MGNVIKTGVLLAALTSLVVLIGGAVGGQQGMLIAFVLAIVMNFGSYWFSDRIVLSMYGAQPIEESQAPDLYRVVRRLTTKAGMPLPRLYIIPGDTPNAFATGRNPQHAAVAVTEGIMRMLDDEESSGGGGVIGAVVMAILAPIAAMLIQMAISRAREFQADASGAQLVGRPWGLAKALEKLEMASKMAPMEATPATAHLFIVNPLSGEGLMALFSTHPPIQERIARLRAMATRS
jgi:heat shock protein HtpX